MRHLLTLTFFLLSFCLTQGQTPSKATMKVVDKALAFSVKQTQMLYTLVENDPKLFPRTVADGELVTNKPSWWTSGFFPGTMWYLYEYSNNKKIRDIAQEMTRRVLPQQYTKTHHDVGFMLNCSAGNGYRLTGNPEYHKALINASKSLATRFCDTVGCTSSWNNPKWSFPVIIDNMMNMELFCIASILTGDPKHYDYAKKHTDRTMECHFREDGSSYHLIDYDRTTGEVIKGVTHQGYSDSSSWARGQAWGLYGYVMMYRLTKDQRYLDHSLKIADFVLNHPNMPEDLIAYWDYDAPEIPNALRDASAAAIMASAFIELSCYVDAAKQQRFLSVGEKIVVTLASKDYRAAKVGDNHGFILMHSVGFMGKNYEVDAPLSYTDYYFVEAMMRLRRLANNEPVVDIYPIEKFDFK